MTIIEQIKAEIERLKATNPSEYNYQNAEGYVWALDDVLSFISTLESEKPIISGDNLDSAINSFWNMASGHQPWFVTLEVKKDGFEKIARYFALWGAEHLANNVD